MDPTTVLVMVALVAAVVLCGAGTWAAIELARTSRDLRASVRLTSQRLVPLLDKADVTVDAVNAELLRIDAIITQFEEAGARVSHASGTLSDIVNAPAEIVSDVAGRVRRAWKDRKQSTAAHEVVVNPTEGAAEPAPDDDMLEPSED